MGYNADIAAYKTQIDNDISTQSLPNSIPPDVVGSGYTDLADLLAPYINAINNEAILSGASVPSSLLGNDLDLYYRLQSSFFELYRKESGAWVLKVTVPFGITLPDGPATLRTFIDGTTASVTKGGWFINNAVYNKTTQTIFSVPAADATFYRTDLIYADTSNNILYATGTPSLTPVDPTLPADTIAVDYVLVPSVASGFDPYLRFGSTTENNGLAAQNNTGALTYEGISVASGTTVNIGACTGYVVDNETDPQNPSIIFVNYPGETNKTVTTLGSGIGTYVLLSGSGSIVFQNTFPTSAERKTHIYLSKIGHPAGVITTAGDEVDFALSPLAQHRDLFQAINYVNNGVQAVSAGATLNFALTTGVITGDGINFVTDNTNPNNYTVAPQPTASFLQRTQTGAGGGFVTTVDVGNYDVAGVVTAIPGGANVSTLRYIFYVPPLGLIVQYGQVTYASLTDAIAAVGKEAFTIYPSLVRNAILIGVLAATKSATALNNTAQARFFVADKFGQIAGAQAGVSIGTFQTAYDNSLQPQAVTDATRGAIQFKRGSAADTDNVFQVLNGAGTANFSVTGDGSIGIGTTAPNHPLTIGSTKAGSASGSTGIALYRTTDQTTNYERLIIRHNSSNQFLIGVEVGGTGSARPIILNTNNRSILINDNTNSQFAIVATNPTVASTNAGIFRTSGGWTGATGTNTTLQLATLYQHTGTSAGRELFISPYYQTVGSGAYNLIDAGFNTAADAGGTHTSAFTVSRTGLTSIFAGAEALKVGTNTGNPDHAYIGLYARTATPTTRSARIGYTNTTDTTLTIINDIATGGVDLRGTGTSAVARIFATNTTFSPTSLAPGQDFLASINTTVPAFTIESSGTSLAAGPSFRGIGYLGTIGAKTVPINGTVLCRMVGMGYESGSVSAESAQVKMNATETWSGSARGSNIEFYTTSNGTTTQTKRMTIEQDGKITTPVGTLQVGLTFSEVIDFPSIGANSNNTQTFTSVSGVAVGDFAILSYDNAADNASIIYKVRIPAANTIQVEAFNLSGGAIDLPSATFNVRVLKF